ncbi:MAG: M23 family metallopeptidase [Clostridiales Family XIII bacterium]|jgi:murein DD-endopeptidase MepM/ murein hydrolase activator NlpD|nr:M23 family metallopeptidase [Clostridiales Family XIII bacterium]
MKKFFTRFAAVLLVAAAGFAAYTGYEYANTGADSVPVANVSFMGTALSPAESEWRLPVLNGLLHKSFAESDGAGARDFGSLGRSPLPLTLSLPEAFDSRVRLFGNDGVVVVDETLSGAAGFDVETGAYTLEIEYVIPERPEIRGAVSGGFVYRCSFSVEAPPEPALLTGKLTLPQGDVVSLKLIYASPDVPPLAETELGMAVFTPGGEGSWRAAIPIGNAQSPGRYTIKVWAGDKDFEIEVEVLPFAFVEQNLIIDTSDPVIGEANSPAAYQEYREKIPPLFATFDAERYWDGVFETPTVGRISTEFGTIRYTNGDYSNPRRHNGMDIAAPEGTPVYAPNAGRAVMAERLLNTGNTIVIEHGGGLKSYFFHMSRLDIAPGDMVEKGELLGAVGTTGYSTGPHLHYETRIGDKPINPSILFGADAGLYSVND